MMHADAEDALDLQEIRRRFDRLMEMHSKMTALDHWLWTHLPESVGPSDTRLLWDEEDRFFVAVPLYEEGRTCGLGATGDVLLDCSLPEIQDALEEARWRIQMEEVSLLVSMGEDGLEVVEWTPDTEDAWFRTSAGDHYVIWRTNLPSVAVGGAFPPPPRPPFLTIRGATWSMAGPENPREPSSYTGDELLPLLEKHGHA